MSSTQNIFTEIISTGGLPENLSQDDFFRGVSKPVNEELAKLFIRLDLMEQTGYGVPMITERYGKNIFEFLDYFLRVRIPFAFEIEVDEQGNTVPKGTTQDTTQDTTQATTQDSQTAPQDSIDAKNNTITDTINQTTQATTQDLSDIDFMVIELIKSNPSISKREIAEKMAWKIDNAGYYMQKLKALGIIKRVGSNQKGHWEIINNK